MKLCGVFSLTPALSRWEREKRFQHWEQIQIGQRLDRIATIRGIQLLFPLPAGEGKGEGEA